MSPARLGALALCVAVTACGDALVGSEYHGEALLTLAGGVEVREGGRLGDQERCRAARAACDESGEGGCREAYDECLAVEVSAAAPWEDAGADMRVALFWSSPTDGEPRTGDS